MFTARIAQQISQAEFFAMDATPAMLQVLVKKQLGITTVLGMVENIQASITEAKVYADLPAKFDAAFSTLILHHGVCPSDVFTSLRKVLKKSGKAVILDMCEHTLTEFKTEMQDVHLCFKLEAVRKIAPKYFTNVQIVKMVGISCSSSGR